MTGPTMTLHSFVFPRVHPGGYQVSTSQQMSGGGLQSSDTLPSRTHHLEVTGPQFSMPGNEVFGVFPPPNANGPFAGRLAQIVLRTRTLPWERSTSSSQPWMALVVLAEAEANFLPDVAASDAYTAGRAPAGIPADARAAALEVPQKVIADAFPAAAELELITHVRHVDPSETEYVDSDGWVSVVIANRLPQPGQSYGAYLISLEGQLDRLPPPGDPDTGGFRPGVFDDVFAGHGVLVVDLPRFGGQPGPVDPVGPVLHGNVTPGAGPTHAFVANDARGRRAGAPAPAMTPKSTTSSARLVRHDIDFTRFHDLFGVDLSDLVVTRFPVLAHWEFTCSDEAKDFAGYMIGLDVGLLGTAPIDDPRAPVVPVAATGHLAIDHTDRRGQSGKAWYRGSFTPSKITREAAGHPYHVADQARRLGPDGREDLSYAAAFEVGRLLAMSDLQFLRSLRQWVRQEFVARRNQDVIGPYLDGLAVDRPYDVDFSRLVARDLLVPGGIGGDPRIRLGNPLPLHEAETLFRPTDTQVIARGLGLEQAFVASMLGTDLATAPVDNVVLDHGLNSFDEVRGAISTLGALLGDLDGFVSEFDAQADQVAHDLAAGRGGPLIEGLNGGRS